MVLLVKPQFEAGKAEVDRGSGVIRDRAVWEQVLIEVERSVRAHGAAIIGGMASPITGADGNVEFLLHVVAGAAGTTPIGVFDPTALVASESSRADGVGKGRGGGGGGRGGSRKGETVSVVPRAVAVGCQ